MTVFTKLHLVRRLLRFHQSGDVKYAQTMEFFFFIKVLKYPRNYDFLKQIKLDDIACRQHEEVSEITSAEPDK